MIFTEQQRHWDAFAHVDPMWAVLSDPRKVGGGWDHNEFYATGRDFVLGQMRAFHQLGLPRGYERALDLGCGPGRNAHALAWYFKEVVGYDISPQMLELAREDADDNETFVLNETDDLAPFEDGTFDLVFSHLVLQHIDRDFIFGYLRESARALKPGGTLSFQMISHPSGLPGTGESGPDPSWEHEGLHPSYEVNPIPIDQMVAELLTMPLVIVQITKDRAPGQSFFSYDYICQKGP